MNAEASPRLRVATYNVHGCVGIDRQRSEKRIAEVIASTSADVVGLQELDRGRNRSAGVDQAAVIAQELGWHHHFQLAMQQPDGGYGDAIISRYSVNVKRTIELPGSAPWYCRETRGAACITAETALGPVDIVNTHFGLGRRERWAQAQLLTSDEWSASSDTPIVLLGDFNSLGWSRSFRLLGRKLRNVRSLLPKTKRLATFPTRWPLIALDHVFVNAALRPLAITVPRTPLARVASDHYPLVVDLLRSSS
ncbi:MAG: endonuclease/exonuclease/phosphatase family protein [Chthoniobacterales bacterium]